LSFLGTPDKLAQFALLTPLSSEGGPSLTDTMIWLIGRLGLISLIVSLFQNNIGWIIGQQNLAQLRKFGENIARI
jgi:hypothetical protein